MLQNFLVNVSEGISEVLFPHVCSICGDSLSITEKAICANCLTSNFELANPDYKMSSGDAILPNGVELQTALWKFDKGGFLQELLHELKYAQRPDIGEDFGKALGWELNKHPYFKQFQKDQLRLLPVPLHAKKKRKRGYNQAYYIAKGVSNTIGVSLCSEADIVRIKNTTTQTGYNLEQRGENMARAFNILNIRAIEGKVIVIIDDVFTTGATTFELASILSKAGAHKILIATIAQA